MANQRPFRFRLPWLSTAPAPPRPPADTQPPRPTIETQAPARPTVTIPIQRPPFRPAGIAPAQPPPQAREPLRAEPQPPSPPSATTEIQTTTQPASPSLVTTQTRSPSVPPSPSQSISQPASPLLGTRQTRSSFQTGSPSHEGRQSRAASLPPSPSQIPAQTQAAVQEAPQLQPQSGLVSQPAVQATSLASSPPRSPLQAQPTASQLTTPSKTLPTTIQETSQIALFASQQEEPKQQVSLPPSQAHQMKTEITSQMVSQSETQKEHIQGPGPVTAVASTTSMSMLEIPATSKKPDGNIISADHLMFRAESVKEMKETEEGTKFDQKQETKGKTNGSAHDEPTTSTTKLHAAPSSSGTRAKEPPQPAFQDQEKKLVKEDSSEGRKIMTISSSGEKIKGISATHQKARSRLIEPHQTPAMSKGGQFPLHKEIREDISKFINKLGVGQAKRPTEGLPVSILTLAGENKGALMHTGFQSERKDESIHIHRGYKINPDESPKATTDADNSSTQTLKDQLNKEDQKIRTFINSNTQGINNSILSQATVDERNPGIHMFISHNLAELTKYSTSPEPLETRKAEFNITTADKLTYEPTVRRRCLRGLFLESSDSDLDNPKKPQRHGCRYSCAEKSTGEDIGVL